MQSKQFQLTDLAIRKAPDSDQKFEVSATLTILPLGDAQDVMTLTMKTQLQSLPETHQDQLAEWARTEVIRRLQQVAPTP